MRPPLGLFRSFLGKPLIVQTRLLPSPVLRPSLPAGGIRRHPHTRAFSLFLAPTTVSLPTAASSMAVGRVSGALDRQCTAAAST